MSGCRHAWILVPLLVVCGVADAQTIEATPQETSPAPEPGWRLEYLEAPAEIALGTMAINIWANITTTESGVPPTAADLVLPQGEKGEARVVAMKPVDGVFDERDEEVVATVDTYTWVEDGAHEFEIRVSGASTKPAVLQRGIVRIKPRIAAADLLLFAHSGEVATWIGTGCGGFAPAGTLRGDALAGTPHLADLDDDGRPDLIFPGSEGTTRIFRNSGAGRFQRTREIATGAGVVAAAVGDVDGDGRPDLVTAGRDLSLEVRLDLADEPTFRGVLDRIPEAIVVADLDGDGADEIWVGLLDLQQAVVERWVLEHAKPTPRLVAAGAPPAPLGPPTWRPVGTLAGPSGTRGRIRQMLRHRPQAAVGPGDGPQPAETLLILTAEESQGVLESWGMAADTQAGSEPSLNGVMRFPGEPLAVLVGRFGPGEEVVWRVAARDLGTGEVALSSANGATVPWTGLREEMAAFAACDLDGDGDDDLITAGRDLRLWINVRGVFREAGESPYLLEMPIRALLAGNLDEGRR